MTRKKFSVTVDTAPFVRASSAIGGFFGAIVGKVEHATAGVKGTLPVAFAVENITDDVADVSDESVAVPQEPGVQAID
jgi:hypothetical protein